VETIAKELGIDCAPALVGFQFGGSCPTFDGFVVCKEFKNTLEEAWKKVTSIILDHHNVIQ